MVNENHFQFDRKTSLIFRKQFTILKTVNRFPKLNSSSLHAHLISNGRNPVMVGRRNPSGTGIRQHPAHRRRMPADQILAETGQNLAMVRSGRIWPKWSESCRSDRIRKSPVILAGSGQTCLSESDNGRLTLPNSENSCSFTFRNFFVRTKRRKIFLRKLFF